MVRSIVDDVGVFGAYKILKLVMAMGITRSGDLKDSSDKDFSLLRNTEWVEIMSRGRMD